jgi:hypothetical protein
MGYTDDDLYGWVTGFITFGFGLLAVGSGILYYFFKKILFRGFIWSHRAGGATMLILFAVHVFPSLSESPAIFTVYYLVVFAFFAELIIRALRLRHPSSPLQFEAITDDLFWLHIDVPSSTRWKAGQWTYLMSPQLGLFERHPFTIALVRALPPSSLNVNSEVPQQSIESHPLLLHSLVRLSFMVRKQKSRGNKSWTFKLWTLLKANSPISIYLDGPFASPATTLNSKSVQRSVLIGMFEFMFVISE